MNRRQFLVSFPIATKIGALRAENSDTYPSDQLGVKQTVSTADFGTIWSQRIDGVIEDYMPYESNILLTGEDPSGTGTIYWLDSETGDIQRTADLPEPPFEMRTSEDLDYFYVSTYTEENTCRGYRVNVNTGETHEWYNGDKFLNATPIFDDKVFINPEASEPPKLLALNLTTGNIEWERTFDSSLNYPWARTDGIYTTTRGEQESTIYRFGFDGQVQWENDLPSSLRVPSVHDERIYVSGENPDQSGSLYAINKETGTPEWRIRTDSEPDRPRSGESNLVFPTGMYDEKTPLTIHVHDIESGRKEWQLVPGEIVDNPDRANTAIGEGFVYFSHANGIIAYHERTGTESWRFSQTSPGWMYTARGRLLFIGTDGVFYALDPQTGSVDWQYELDGSGDGSSVRSRPNRLYVTGESQMSAIRRPSKQTGDIEVSIANNFVNSDPRGVMELVFNAAEGAVTPPGVGDDPDKNEAYINVDIEVILPTRESKTIAEVVPRFRSPGWDANFGPEQTAFRQTGPQTYRIDNLQIATLGQVGITFFKALMMLLSLRGVNTGEVGSAVETQTQSYPDVTLDSVLITYEDGSKESYTVDKQLPRYIDVCPDSALRSIIGSQECNLDNYTQTDLENAEGVAVLSPATTLVTDSQGQRCGRRPSEYGFEVFDEISDGFYSGPLDDEFVLVPQGEYEMEIFGTGSGKATIQIETAVDGDKIRQHQYQDIPVTESTVISHNGDSASLTVSSDGQDDRTVDPSETTVNAVEAYLEEAVTKHELPTNQPESSNSGDPSSEDSDEEGSETPSAKDSEGNGSVLGEPIPLIGAAIAGIGGGVALLKRMTDTDNE